MKVMDTTGKSAGRVKLPDKIFAAQASPKLLAQAVRVYLANQRQGTVKVKRRGEVKGSGRKIWRQKGTGRARHGDRYAPIFVGGGIAHGPTGSQRHKLKLSKVMRRKALFAALTQKTGAKELIIVDGLEKLEPKTKVMYRAVTKVTSKAPKKLSIILPDGTDSVIRGARNIKGVKLLSAKRLNAFEVLNAGMIILMKSAVKPIEERFLGKKPKTTEHKQATKKKPERKKAPAPSGKAKKTRTKTARKTRK